MAQGTRDNALLAIIGLVGLVLAGGVLVMDGDAPSGRVVAGPDPCASCEGVPVCAAQGAVVDTYPSACAATCDGARVVYERPCKDIPRAVV